MDKALGNSVLLVTWQPPKMDSSDGNYSNGCFVTGYQLYVNGETKNLISGAMHTKVSSFITACTKSARNSSSDVGRMC